jgi:hypothetical protein
MLDYIAPVIAMTLSSVNVYYLHSLERLGCQCSLTGKRAYILGFNLFTIALGLFSIFIGGNKALSRIFLTYPLLYIALLVATLVNVAFTIQFVNEMKRENCACSDSIFKDVLYVLALMQAITWSILGLVVLVTAGLFTKEFATGRMTMKNIEVLKSIAGKAVKKAVKK